MNFGPVIALMLALIIAASFLAGGITTSLIWWIAQ